MANASPKKEHLRTSRTVPEMVKGVHDDWLVGAKEPWLLKALALHLERNNPAVDGKKCIADLLQRSTKYVESAMNGETFIGTDAWFRLQLAAGVDIYSRYLFLNYLKARVIP